MNLLRHDATTATAGDRVTATEPVTVPHTPRAEQMRAAMTCDPALPGNGGRPLLGPSEPHASDVVTRNIEVRSAPSTITAKLPASIGSLGSPAAKRNTTIGLSDGTLPAAGG